MIHTREKLLSNSLTDCNAGEHKCCIDKAMTDWANIFTSVEHRDFFFGLIRKTIEESDSPLDAMTQISVMCLALGSVCGLGMIPQLIAQIPEELQSRLRGVIKGKGGEIH